MDRQKFAAILKDVWSKWSQTHSTPEAFAQSLHDNCIADPEVIFRYLNIRRLQLADKKSESTLTQTENGEFEILQEGVFDAIDVMHPRPEPVPLPEQLQCLSKQIPPTQATPKPSPTSDESSTT